jgi:hypothetical protein
MERWGGLVTQHTMPGHVGHVTPNRARVFRRRKSNFFSR